MANLSLSLIILMFEKYVLFFNMDHADFLRTVDLIKFLGNPLLYPSETSGFVYLC